MDHEITANSFVVIETEEDPDGAERGGYHQVTHAVKVEGATLKVSRELSDYYEERFGGAPEPLVEDKDDAVTYLEAKAVEFEQQAAACRQLATKVKQTTEFEGAT